MTGFFERLWESSLRLIDEGGIVLVCIVGASVLAWGLLLAKWFSLRAEARATDDGVDYARGGRRRLAALWMSSEHSRLQQGLRFLQAVVALLPLLGLLGTVLGMLKTFDVIQMQGTGDPRLMADGIRQALITTQAGMLAVIPVLLLCGYMASKSNRTASKMELAVQRELLGQSVDRTKKEVR